jgi:addiction module HigA family antidote
LEPLGLLPYALAATINVPRTRVERVAREEARTTVDTVLRLGRHFGTTAAFWINVQAQYDLEVANDACANGTANIGPRTPKAPFKP